MIVKHGKPCHVFVDMAGPKKIILQALADCVKNVILSEAKDPKWPKNEILRYAQNDKKRERCFFTQPAGLENEIYLLT